MGASARRSYGPRTRMPQATRTHYETETPTIEIVPDDHIVS